MNKSFKEKYYLYVFLIKFSKKENKNILVFLVLCFEFIFLWIWNKFSFKNLLMKKVVIKLKEVKIDYFVLFIVIDEYFESLEFNENYFL